MRAGRDDEAIQKFNEIVTKIPTCSDCYYNLGVAYSKKQQFAEAENLLQEGDRAGSEQRRRVHRARQRLQRAEEVRPRAAGQRQSRGARRSGRRRRKCRSRLQPGRDSVERRQVRRGEGAVRSGGKGRPEHGDGALSARHGQSEPRSDSRGASGVRGISEGGSERSEGGRSPDVPEAAAAVARGLQPPRPMSSIADRLTEVRSRIAAAARSAGRDPSSVRLIAVSKTFSLDLVREAYAAGQRDFGENRVQEALQKIRATPATWISDGICSATCRRTKPSARLRRSPRSTRSTASSCSRSSTRLPRARGRARSC